VLSCDETQARNSTLSPTPSAPLSPRPDAVAISNLPARIRNTAYTLVNLGPNRPQPDVSPLAGTVDAGTLSAELGGGDKPYGTGYSALVSNELCLTVPVVKEGAEVRCGGWLGSVLGRGWVNRWGLQGLWLWQLQRAEVGE
jgi:hypothetical protein